jgi:hypothetical protein
MIRVQIRDLIREIGDPEAILMIEIADPIQGTDLMNLPEIETIIPIIIIEEDPIVATPTIDAIAVVETIDQIAVTTSLIEETIDHKVETIRKPTTETGLRAMTNIAVIDQIQGRMIDIRTNRATIMLTLMLNISTTIAQNATTATL